MKRLVPLFPLALLCFSCGGQSTSSSSSSSSIWSSSIEESTSSSIEESNPAIKVEEGRCQPIYSINCSFDEHNPKTSTIARFTVYIETDYDTDFDGKLDLVKAFVQLPRTILEKGYKVASIIECSPYTCATTDLDEEDIVKEQALVKDEDLYRQGSKRNPAPEIDLLSHNEAMDVSEFCYEIGEGEDAYTYYEDAQDCDYFLSRGFAFINIGGYGTLGSDGLETVGTRIETHAYSCLIDWLNDERIAFSDYEGTHTVKASFSNGSYGAEGASYLGTTAYQLSCMGLKGLKAIIPTAAIASWYEYTNSQGAAQNCSSNCAWLSLYCASKMYEENLSEDYINTYGGYLRYVQQEEIASNGDYNDFWAKRDYTVNVKPSCPALIIHGVNDFNVPVRHAALMYQTIKKAGQTAKLLFHQGDHLAFYGGYRARSIDGYEESFNEVANRWYSHYLYDVDNGIEDFPDFTYQSNVDGKFYSSSDILEASKKAITLSNPSRESITSKDMKFFYEAWNDSYYDKDDANSISFVIEETDEDKQINGIPELNIHLKTNDVGRDNLQVTAVLLDTYSEEFPCYGADNFEITSSTYADKSFEVYPGEEGTYRYCVQERTNAKMISCATFDLYNPGTRNFGEQLARTELEEDKSYEYQVYFDPTAYTLEKGHTLKCVLFTFDPGLVSKWGYFADSEDEEYDGETDVMFTPATWTTTESYGYTLDMSNAPILSLPY
ncbi:MAG: prolyl oligopeptidase family serine peptidase [Bacilli bacterium]|nr:prolyl oligopeptidase family serine peptidase [Bacilli bacterium]